MNKPTKLVAQIERKLQAWQRELETQRSRAESLEVSFPDGITRAWLAKHQQDLVQLTDQVATLKCTIPTLRRRLRKARGASGVEMVAKIETWARIVDTELQRFCGQFATLANDAKGEAAKGES